MKLVPRALLLFAVIWALSGGAGHAYLSDGATYSTDTSLSSPPSGSSYTDPVFGTTIKRVSDARSMQDNAGGGLLQWVITEYSTMSAFNAGGSRFIVQHESYYGLYDGAGNYLGDLPFSISASTEPRWSRASSSLLYYINGNELHGYDVASGSSRLVRAFPEYASIGGKGESDIGFTGDRFVLVGDNQDIFVYDVASDTPSSHLYTGGRGFDSVHLTPNGNVIVSWLEYGTGPYQGIELYDGNMNPVRNLTPTGGHMDVTRDSSGAEVLIWTNSNDRNPLPGCDNGVVKVRLADAAQTCLMSLDWSLAKQIAAPDGNGWAYVATYAPSDPDPSSPEWKTYTNELLQVKLDGTEVRRLAHHRSRPFDSYNWQPRPMVSRDGTRLLYSSNFGEEPAHSDVYLIDLTTTAPGGGGDGSGGDDGGSDGGGDTGGVTLLEETDPAISYSGPWFVVDDPKLTAGTAMEAMDKGARARLTFEGTGVRWIGYKDQWAGKAVIHLDGKRVDRVDTAADPQEPQAVIYEVTGLARGQHTLEIEVTGQYDRRTSDGSWVWIDAFEVIG